MTKIALKSFPKFTYQNLPKPFLSLAPMEDVTDTVFRRLIAECGRPDLMYTEFTSCEGVQSVAQAKVIHRLKYSQTERPLIAQVWGVTPNDYYKTAKLILDLGFDGIDINMGCPVKKVIKQGACSALIKNPDLAIEIIQAVHAAIKGCIPVSVKTRIGFAKIETEAWITRLLKDGNLDCLVVHGRTAKQMSKVPNNWLEIQKAREIRDTLNSKTLIVGNGDIQSRFQALETANIYKLDGIMIGRGIFSNPWLFNPDYHKDETGNIIGLNGLVTVDQRIQLMEKHIALWKQEWGRDKNPQILKKYFKIYLQGFEGANKLRQEWMEKDLF